MQNPLRMLFQHTKETLPPSLFTNLALNLNGLMGPCAHLSGSLAQAWSCFPPQHAVCLPTRTRWTTQQGSPRNEGGDSFMQGGQPSMSTCGIAVQWAGDGPGTGGFPRNSFSGSLSAVSSCWIKYSQNGYMTWHSNPIAWGFWFFPIFTSMWYYLPFSSQYCFNLYSFEFLQGFSFYCVWLASPFPLQWIICS